MNFDVVFYYTLNHVIAGYKGYAAALFGAGFILHWVRGTYVGAVEGRFHQGAAWWKTAVLTFLVFTVCYVPVPNPGLLIGFRDNDVDLNETGHSTIAIFLLERISYGFDTLALDVIGWDMTVRAQEESGSPDRIYNFIILRGQFLHRIANQLWTRQEPAQGATDPDSVLGTWDLLTDENYLSKQVSLLLYNLMSLVGVVVLYAVLLLFGGLLFLLAGIAKYVPILVAGVFFFLLPFSWLIKGRKALNALFYSVIVYLPLKAVIVLVIAMTFYIVESIQIQGYLDLLAGNAELMAEVAQASPGWLYTPAGSAWAEHAFVSGSYSPLDAGIGYLALSLVSMLVALLAMLYTVFKAPGITTSMLTRFGLADDVIGSTAAIAATVISGGISLLALGKSGKNSVQGGPP